MANDTKKRCNIHSEKKFVLAKEIKVTKLSSACWLSLMYDGNVLTIYRSHKYTKYLYAKLNSASGSMCLELIILKRYYTFRLSLMKILSHWVKITS